jgi:hypothetical protein
MLATLAHAAHVRSHNRRGAPHAHRYRANVVMESSGGPSEQVRALMDRTWKGPVTIVQSEVQVHPNTERYATVFVCFSGRVAVSWCSGDEHSFDARTGLCIESSDGRMKGWRIAPWEMHRFNMVDAQAYIDANRTNRMSTGSAPVIAAAASMGGGVELNGQQDVLANPLWDLQKARESARIRQVLVVVSPALFSVRSTTEVVKDTGTPASNALLELAGVTTPEDMITVCQTGDSLLRKRIDVVITTDDFFGVTRDMDLQEAKWWTNSVRPRFSGAVRLMIVSSTQAVKRAIELSTPVPTASTQA